MQNKLSFPLLLASTALLSACNTTDHYYYSHGPWGPTTVSRHYPTYTAPWGPIGPASVEASIVRTPLYIDGGGMDPMIREVRVPSSRVEAILPPDPTPRGPVPGQYGSDLYGSPLGDSYGGGSEVYAAAPSPIPARQASLLVQPDNASPPTRASAYSGSWKTVDDKGAVCRIHLSTAATLDLYKASASGCSNADLRNVNSWSFGNNTVTLYQRGKVVARLSGQEANLAGTLDGSHGSVRMTR